MSKATYNTKQKKLIYDFLYTNSSTLLTCDEIFDGLKAQCTPVGKATLYRFLDMLVSSGDARKVLDDSKKSAAYQLLDKNLNCESHSIVPSESAIIFNIFFKGYTVNILHNNILNSITKAHVVNFYNIRMGQHRNSF